MQLQFSLLCFRPWHVAVKFCNTGSVRLYEVWLFYFLPYFVIKKEIKVRLFGFANFAFSSLFVVWFQDRVTFVGIVLILMTNIYQKRKEEKRKKGLAVFSLKTMHMTEFFVLPILFTKTILLPDILAFIQDFLTFHFYWFQWSTEERSEILCSEGTWAGDIFSKKEQSHIITLCCTGGEKCG